MPPSLSVVCNRVLRLASQKRQVSVSISDDDDYIEIKNHLDDEEEVRPVIERSSNWRRCELISNSPMPKRKWTRSGCMEDILQLESRKVFVEVYNSDRKLLFLTSKPLLQKLSRDVLNALAYRWEKDQGCRQLSTHNVRVRDHQAFLPKEGSRHDSKDYPMLYLRFLQIIFNPVQGVFGAPGYEIAPNVRAREDLFKKLCTPNLSLEQFRNLYFHLFLQTEEERCDFPALAVWNLRNMRVEYDGAKAIWTDAYRSWDRDHDREEINLFSTSLKNVYVWRLYYGNRKYRDDDPVDEAELVRNGITHFNQCVMKGVRRPVYFYNKRQMGEVFFDLFPNVGFRLYDFMWQCGVNMDFTMSCMKSYKRNPTLGNRSKNTSPI
ncbi:hypothetical protein M0R45_015561 [Rubus argutus]|uniref:Uncharacterized protein n=1 Tax=Rubus argutus TaxID=59490 RepID=A0AAW1XQ58_RUBAR